MSDIQLSIIIPLFNKNAYISEAIETVLHSEINDFELIIIDDGSTDGSDLIAKEIASQYSGSIKYIEHDLHANLGISATRNFGIKQAKGEYISFLDADDIVSQSRFHEAIHYLSQHRELDGIIQPVDLLFENEQSNELWKEYERRFGCSQEITNNNLLKAMLLENICRVLTPSFVIKKSLLNKTGLFSEKYKLSEDFHFWLRLAACGKFEYLDSEEPAAWYRRNDQNTWYPDKRDSFRDIDVLSDVFRWAKKSDDLQNDSLAILSSALKSKLIYCLELARDLRSLKSGIKSLFMVLRVIPSLLFSRLVWKKVLLLPF